MLVRLLFTSMVLGLVPLTVPTSAKGQSCKDCGTTTQRCLDAPDDEVVCIEITDPEGEDTCQSWEEQCSPDLHVASLDVVGMPVAASHVTFEEVTSDIPPVRSCDLAVLRFVFNRERLVELRQASDHIML